MEQSLEDGEECVNFMHGVEYTFKDALETDTIVYEKIRSTQIALDFKNSLSLHSSTLETLVAFHLGVDPGQCKLDRLDQWKGGSFNIVIPVAVGTDRRVILRCPIPVKHAELQYPGSVLEKMSSEVATYIWMQENCPSIRIPMLYGFGLPNSHHFTHADKLPFLSRLYLKARRLLYKVFRHRVPSLYTRVAPPSAPTAAETLGYMVLEHLEPRTHEMLPFLYAALTGRDEAKQQNLFRGIAKVMLALARVPQPRIGSWRFHDKDGTISLSNRPATSEIQLWESAGAPKTMRPRETYLYTDAYISDIVTFHDNRFLSDRNAVRTEYDAREQMLTKLMLRASAHHFYPKEHRYGPFVMQHTDFNFGNMIIDQDCNIRAILDLEWIITRPVTMLSFPHWTSLRDIGKTAKSDKGFTDMYYRFVDIFEEEEKKVDMSPIHKALGCSGPLLSGILRESMEMGRYWFNISLSTPDAMYPLFRHRIFPLFHFPIIPATVYSGSLLWSPHTNRVVMSKLRERQHHVARVAELFGKKEPPPEPEPSIKAWEDGGATRAATDTVLKYIFATDPEFEKEKREYKETVRQRLNLKED